MFVLLVFFPRDIIKHQTLSPQQNLKQKKWEVSEQFVRKSSQIIVTFIHRFYTVTVQTHNITRFKSSLFSRLCRQWNKTRTLWNFAEMEKTEIFIRIKSKCADWLKYSQKINWKKGRTSYRFILLCLFSEIKKFLFSLFNFSPNNIRL